MLLAANDRITTPTVGEVSRCSLQESFVGSARSDLDVLFLVFEDFAVQTRHHRSARSKAIHLLRSVLL
jgi:hypothetical protein